MSKVRNSKLSPDVYHVLYSIDTNIVIKARKMSFIAYECILIVL